MDTPKTKVIELSFDNESYDDLTQLANITGINNEEVIREAITLYFYLISKHKEGKKLQIMKPKGNGWVGSETINLIIK